MDKKELLERVSADNVKFISLQFTDINGAVKSVDMPVSGFERALDVGLWFDGSSVEGFARIQESDMRLVIDKDTYTVLPWSPEERRRARVFCDIFLPDGQPFEGDPRSVLKRILGQLKERGWTYNIGPEPEFFLFQTNHHNDQIHPVPHDVGSYFDFSANDEAVLMRTELMEMLDEMGLDIEVGHHEVALGQHEIDFKYADALRTADNVLTFKYTVKAIAARHGLTASFMPKPIFGINGSGMHCHQSLFAGETNLFFDGHDPQNLSKIAYGFIAGQLKHARALSGIVAPTVNSYKRLVPGYEAPVYIGWAQENRSALIRIPRYTPGLEKSVRAELRCPDPSANPYLAFAVMLVAGLDGIDQALVPPAPLNNINVYELSETERQKMDIQQLPGSLLSALRELDNDPVLIHALGETIYTVFRRAKLAEWDEFRTRVSDWELEKYLETV